MVLYENITLNQRVELKRRGKIYQGVVKFKGCLNGVPGEWVGVELYENVGDHDGMIKGRRYFSCNPGHGIFVPSEKLRFSTKKRCLYNSYRSVERNPEVLVDHELFSTERPASATPYDPKVISREKYETLWSADLSSTRDPFVRERSFHLRHSVSGTLPAATWLSRPHTASTAHSRSYRPLHYHNDDFEEWSPSVSIPSTHMPVSAMRQQLVRGGWEAEGDQHLHYPRHWPAHNARESLKWRAWNDVSY